MIELPEAVTLASQINESLDGATIERVVAGHSPHKWAWFHGDPAGYDPILRGKAVGRAESHGGFVEIRVDDVLLVFAEGVNLRLHAPGRNLPKRHQLLVELEDGRALTASVQMYGSLLAGRPDELENTYVEAARSAPSPLSGDFDADHFDGIVGAADVQKLSVKALLATEQRVPGLGNGVLQDILFEARLHPRRKVSTLSRDEVTGLRTALTSTLHEMSRLGGRDTEKDLLGRDGGYATRCSRKTVGQACTRCGGTIEKASFLGGTVYFCAGCQPPR